MMNHIFKSQSLGALVRKFRRDEQGTATVESLIWLTFLVAFTFMILDAAMVFMNNTEVRRITQDANRLFIKGIFDDNTSSLETWIEGQLDGLAPNADATATIDSDGRLSTVVVYPATDTDLVGLVEILNNVTLQVVVVHQTET